MDEHAARLIRDLYTRGDALALLTAVVDAAKGGPLDRPLACLEQAVTEKRLAWLRAHGHELRRTGDPLHDGFHAFYEHYLGLAVPADGEIVARTPDRLVSRWWNRCPTLDACLRLGLDTREVCARAYQRPVETFLRGVDPRLRFGRNYQALRPHATYCEETISLEG